ncbi:MAG: Sulfite oxidase [Solirubrobacterales bacterium]|nr:Sulfite oxidase [Solirubrobacterales bacterium]
MRNGRVFGAPAPTSPPWACENRLTATDETRTRTELPGVETSEQITPAELRLATRNHGFPLEALSYDLTPAGLHYLLVHYDIPVVDGESWRLRIGGSVANELSLSLEELRARPEVTLAVTLECAGNGRAQLSPRPVSQPWLLEAVGTAEWTGTPLRGLLDEAGVDGCGVEVLFRGLDRGVEGGRQQQFERSLPLAEATREEVLLAYAMNGRPLPPQHGFPLRLVVPGWYGMASVKWLERIIVLDRPFEGYQQARGYRLRQTPDEPGVPVSRMMPRSLMAPPGIPDFATRERMLELRPCTVQGRAWSGFGPIERVEVSADGGAGWGEARLGPQPSAWAWRSWQWVWEPPGTGVYELCCRATDSAGNVQPLRAPWNLGGYANNQVQRVPVVVEPAA